jgi:hypothetical protein
MISLSISGGLTAQVVADRFEATFTGTKAHPDVVTFYRGDQIVGVLRQTVSANDQVTHSAFTAS